MALSLWMDKNLWIPLPTVRKAILLWEHNLEVTRQSLSQYGLMTYQLEMKKATLCHRCYFGCQLWCWTHIFPRLQSWSFKGSWLSFSWRKEQLPANSAILSGLTFNLLLCIIVCNSDQASNLVHLFFHLALNIRHPPIKNQKQINLIEQISS